MIPYSFEGITLFLLAFSRRISKLLHMKAKSILPWIFVLASVSVAIFLQAANKKAQTELTELRADQVELAKLREQMTELKRLETLEPELERLRKESMEVHKLRNNVRQLTEESKQLAAQLQTQQAQSAAPVEDASLELNRLRAENEMLRASAAQQPDAVPIEQTLEEYKSVCVDNLRQLSGALAQWGLENSKNFGDIPEYEALLTYVATPPACPQGGSYTIAGVGKPPTCNMTGHKLP